jgi:hypothetical protein
MDKNQLPWWMQWLQAVALIAIPVIGAWLAYKQARIAEAKLNLDLYEKRFAVFQAARKLLSKVSQQTQVDMRDIDEFTLDVLDAGFLFNERVEKYLDGLRNKALDLWALSEELKAENDQNKRADLIRKRSTLFKQLVHEFPVARETFKPYLVLGLIESHVWSGIRARVWKRRSNETN